MAVSLLSKLRDVPLVFVDVETTGASTDFCDRVIEVGIVRYEQGCPVGIPTKPAILRARCDNPAP